MERTETPAQRRKPPVNRNPRSCGHPRQRPTLQLRNVIDHLPKDQKDQVKSVLRAAWKMDAKGGMARLKKLAEWLEREYPSAAASLLEGLEECFTINRLDVPPSLHRCLATTNLIESPHSGVRMRTRRVCRWRDGGMVKRWMASAFLATEKNLRKMMGYRDLWTLEAILNGPKSATAGGVVTWARTVAVSFQLAVQTKGRGCLLFSRI